MEPNIDMAKALQELPILRGFIDFVNRQVGMYSDCLSGFQGNKVRIERQVARVNHPVSRRVENGQAVIVYVSVEDPAMPDVIHHRIIRASDFMDANSEAQFNEQHICWAIIVFLFAYWDEEIRPQIATIRGVKPNEIQFDALGDLRILRGCIVHNGGVMTQTNYSKLKILHDVTAPDNVIAPTHDQMHKIFAQVKRAIADLTLHYTSHLPGAPQPGEVVEVAIQNPPRGNYNRLK